VAPVTCMTVGLCLIVLLFGGLACLLAAGVVGAVVRVLAGKRRGAWGAFWLTLVGTSTCAVGTLLGDPPVAGRGDGQSVDIRFGGHRWRLPEGVLMNPRDRRLLPPAQGRARCLRLVPL
jgi:hypothetical protein